MKDINVKIGPVHVQVSGGVLNIGNDDPNERWRNQGTVSLKFDETMRRALISFVLILMEEEE